MPSKRASTEFYTVGQLCRAVGASPRAVRLYEEQGLLTAQRDALNHRLFDQAARDDLALIVCLRGAGISLAEIGLLLSQPAHGAIRQRRIDRLLRARKAYLSAELETVEAARQRLAPRDPVSVRRLRAPHAV
ncbi:MAG: MerR family transcriptional regulator [Phenylobacterium sp.]